MRTNVDPPKFGRGMPAGVKKVHVEEPECRVCGRSGVEAAHLVPRSLGATGYDNADVLVPLCKKHHGAFDRGKLELLPHLSLDEQAATVKLLGIERARNRLTVLGSDR